MSWPVAAAAANVVRLFAAPGLLWKAENRFAHPADRAYSPNDPIRPRQMNLRAPQAQNG
jgi:hypothetical protein